VLYQVHIHDVFLSLHFNVLLQLSPIFRALLILEFEALHVSRIVQRMPVDPESWIRIDLHNDVGMGVGAGQRGRLRGVRSAFHGWVTSPEHEREEHVPTGSERDGEDDADYVDMIERSSQRRLSTG
jgi:hypothetical protein